MTGRCTGCEELVSFGEWCEKCSNEKIHGDYTRRELGMAFDRVKDAKHWKNPIDKTLAGLSPADVQVIHHAVVFYTGSVPKFTYKAGMTRVRAKGYFLAVGA